MIETVATFSPHGADEKGATSLGATTMAKTMCPVSHEQFRTSAKPLTCVYLDVDGKEVFRTIFRPREMGTGSLGWYPDNAKPVLNVSGASCSAQLGSLVLIGSKPNGN